MPKILLSVCFWFFLTDISFSQPKYSFQNEIKFASHLIDNYQYKDATLVLKNLSKTATLNSSQFDSVNYYIGWIHYNKKNLDSSSFYLNRVSSNSPFYFKSTFYHAFNKAYLRQTSEAITILNTTHMDTLSDYSKLKNFELAAFSLLQHNYSDFEKYSSQFTGTYFPITLEEKSLNDYYTEIKNHKAKSPWLAGAMSAVVPGSGKFYTDHKGEGLTAFATVMSIAAVAAESYYRAGPKSVQFISFTSLFAVFYIGNIWGSATSVKRRNDTFYKEIERNVLLDMHIPLRRVFN